MEDVIVQDELNHIQYQSKKLIFDEVWSYNCLQHVDNLELILGFLPKIASTVRLFEWINLGKCPGHPHTLTENMFLSKFPETEWVHHIWNTGVLRGFGGTVTNNYLSFHVTRKDSQR